MSTEYGIFNDEGCVEPGFFSREEALEAIAKRYPDEEGLEVEEICHDHEGQPREGCEECATEDDEDSKRTRIAYDAWGEDSDDDVGSEEPEEPENDEE